MTWQIEQRNGLYLPELNWYLDARKPVAQSFVSHAHFDHMGDHETILCSPPTAALIQQRLSGGRNWRIQEFGQPFQLEPGINACLHPAGHIIGSSMLWLEKDGRSLLYTGDFKLTPGASAEPCQPVSADTLIIESTYGIPRYTFPPEKEVYKDIIRFCLETLENGDTPVLFGYSLGKSQAILRSLSEASLEVMLHPSALKLTLACQKLGWTFPLCQPFEARSHKGKVVISPPLPKSAEWLRSIHNPKTAMISGWAIDSSAKYRYQCDRAFPLSDHADYLDLLSFVEKVRPKEVYTVHGFAKEFAETLRGMGYRAWALGRENQLGFEMGPPTEPQPAAPIPQAPLPQQDALPANSLAALAQMRHSLSSTDSENKKQSILHSFLADLATEEVTHCIRLLDTPNPQLTEGLTPRLVQQSLLLATNTSESEFKRLSQSGSDASQNAAPLLEKLANPSVYSIGEACTFLKTLATAPNPTFKQSMLSELFKKLSPPEGLFLYEHLSQSSSNGLTPQLICQAIASRFGLDVDSVQAAYLRSNSLPDVSTAATQDALPSIKIEFFKPILALEAMEETKPEAIIEKQGFSLWSEPDFDGLRCQLHKNGEHAELYSKSGERISHQFPEILEAARLIPQHFIADTVIVPWKDESPAHKSELDRRLNRRAEELFLGEEIPVVLWLIDLLCIGGDDLIDTPLEQRRQKLDTFSVNAEIRIAPVTMLIGVEQIEAAQKLAGRSGYRGLVFKAAKSAYNPLSPTPDWLSLPASNRA